MGSAFWRRVLAETVTLASRSEVEHIKSFKPSVGEPDDL